MRTKIDPILLLAKHDLVQVEGFQIGTQNWCLLARFVEAGLVRTQHLVGLHFCGSLENGSREWETGGDRNSCAGL